MAVKIPTIRVLIKLFSKIAELVIPVAETEFSLNYATKRMS